jgi:hypothetical protein
VVDHLDAGGVGTAPKGSVGAGVPQEQTLFREQTLRLCLPLFLHRQALYISKIKLR